MDPVQVFFCEPTGEGVCRETYKCACGEYPSVEVGRFREAERPEFPSGKKTTCSSCGKEAELWSQGFDLIYRRADTGEEVGVGRYGKMPAGACYDMESRGYRKGPDGRALVVWLPDGMSWAIDSRANNCKREENYSGFCWVRTGKPEDGTLDVRSCGCGAGAGSIRTSKYHGFLHRGFLVACKDKIKSKKKKKG